MSRICSIRWGSPARQPDFTIFPFTISKRMPSKRSPDLVMLSVLYWIVPFIDSRTGAVKTSPSGMLRCPTQGTAPIPWMLNSSEVSPGPTMRTWSVRSISSWSGRTARSMAG